MNQIEDRKLFPMNVLQSATSKSHDKAGVPQHSIIGPLPFYPHNNLISNTKQFAEINYLPFLFP